MIIIKVLKQIIKKGTIKENVLLAQYTTIKIGGPARFFIQTEDETEIMAVLQFCRQNRLPWFVLGGGSNVVFSDQGFNGVVLKLLSGQYRIVREHTPVEIEFPAGYSSHLASVKMMEAGYSGFESLYGLPGTIGGAIYQNSKWPRGNYQVSDNLKSVVYLDNHFQIQTKTKSELDFSYGFSSFQKQKCLILKATFIFTIKSPDQIQLTCREVMRYRQQSQPIGVLTAGCIFKNLEQGSAGYYIDKAGLKSKHINDLVVSSKHANFFVNQSQARAQDYLKLVALVKSEVKRQFNIDLKEEVLFVQ